MKPTRNVVYEGHGVNTGGLQNHSVGDSYPFMVVGTQHVTMDKPSKETRYYVLDCATGRRFYWKNLVTGHVQTWGDIKDAHFAAQFLSEGNRPDWAYLIK